MRDFIVAFGKNHIHLNVPNGAGGTVTVDENSVVCINAESW